jgi:histone chaperone ASF1
MYPIEILYIKVLNNFCKIDSLFIFEVLYEVKYVLQNDFEVKIVYITSPLEKDSDQELEIFIIPAKKKGKYKILLKIKPPDYKNIKLEEITEITVILLIVSYNNKELVRIGYYLNNEIVFKNETNPTNSLEIDYILRKILSDKPRITYFSFNQNIC